MQPMLRNPPLQVPRHPNIQDRITLIGQYVNKTLQFHLKLSIKH